MPDTEQARLTVQVKPNAKKNEIIGFKDGVLQVRVAAPPIDGKANGALVKFLSATLGLNQSSIAIEKGLSGRLKTVLIRGLSREQVEKAIESFLK